MLQILFLILEHFLVVALLQVVLGLLNLHLLIFLSHLCFELLFFNLNFDVFTILTDEFCVDLISLLVLFEGSFDLPFLCRFEIGDGNACVSLLEEYLLQVFVRLHTADL